MNCKIYISISDLFNFQENKWKNSARHIDGYIFKFNDSNSGIKTKELLEKMNSLLPKSVFVEMPRLEDHIEEYSEAWENIGYVLSGGKEIKAGFKDFYELAPVLEYLEDQ